LRDSHEKVLFTLLALGRSGGALAQSSVTIYGVADAGLVLDKDAAGDRLTASPGRRPSSRIGFKGKEDLGGGLSANFVLESGFNIDTGTFGRRAYGPVRQRRSPWAASTAILFGPARRGRPLRHRPGRHGLEPDGDEYPRRQHGAIHTPTYSHSCRPTSYGWRSGRRQ
jgi:hypothetical protein